jgi:c(7)-type cytochrome triheme protein
MKKLTAILVVLVAFVLVGNVYAVAPGKTVEFAGGAKGKVVFDGKSHADKGLKCNDCHTKLFQMKKGSFKMTLADHGTDMGCGACHNGTKAFGQKDEANCGKCHKK